MSVLTDASVIKATLCEFQKVCQKLASVKSDASFIKATLVSLKRRYVNFKKSVRRLRRF